VNFFRRLALQEKKKLDDSSRLDVVEIARVADMFLACFLPGQAKDLSARRYNTKDKTRAVRDFRLPPQSR